MPAITEKDLRGRIKSGGFGGAYLICGEDTYRKEAAVRLLQNAASSGGFGGFGSHAFDGKDADLDDIAEAAETVPLMGGSSCVTVRDMPFDSLSDGQIKKLKALPALVPPESALIFWQTGELKKTSRMRSIIKLFDEKGFVLDCAKLGSGELERLLIQGAKKRGCVLSGAAAKYLVQSVGNDLNLLLRELEKLCAYATTPALSAPSPEEGNIRNDGEIPLPRRGGGEADGVVQKASGEVTTEHIDLLCAKTLEATAFDLSRALLAGDMARALGFLDNLFGQRAEPVMIMGALNTAFIDLYQVKLAQGRVRGISELAALFPAAYKGREFRLHNAAGRAQSVPLARLRICLKYLHEADKLLKSSPAPKRPLLERTVLSLGLALRTRRV